MPQISVIVPVYKVENYLRRCVDSILSQTFSDFDLILVNDGSPDNCGKICDEYVERDSRVHVIHQENRGQETARNIGIEWAFANSTSEWLMILDSDDWFHPQMFEKLYDAAKSNGVKLSFCKHEDREEYEEESQITDFDIKVLESEDAFVEYTRFLVTVWAKCYSKDLFQHIRYPDGRISGDSFVTHQLVFEAERVAMVDCALYYYFINPNGIVQSKWTPRRLDGLVGREEQIAYFERIKKSRALVSAIKAYVGQILNHLKRIPQSDWAGSKYETVVRNKLRRVLIKYPEIYSFKENTWLYEIAFPRMMTIYWRGCGIKAKLMRMIK